ncbi:MAG: hypothetical protein KAR17_16545, partial [Cyclobacteriaceae bacterium]|nr:hypothetical protein [Cyclobacteriaceae bacterium]
MKSLILNILTLSSIVALLFIGACASHKKNFFSKTYHNTAARYNAFFIANEIFDAFPCELFFKGKTGRVEEDGNVEFDVDNEWVSEKAAKYHKDRGEVAVGYEEFAKEMAGAAKTFEFMSFD